MRGALRSEQAPRASLASTPDHLRLAEPVGETLGEHAFPIPKINCSRGGAHASLFRTAGFNFKIEVQQSRVTRAARRMRRGTIVGLASLGCGSASGARSDANENRVVGAACRNCDGLLAGFRPVALNPLIRRRNNNYSVTRPSLMPTSFPYAALRRANGAP
jgi:hypothetical protein